MPSTFHAVHDDDLEQFLKSLGVFEKFKAGQLRCCFCFDQITESNLYSIFPDSGDIKFSCDKSECLVLLKTQIEGKKYGTE